MIWLLVICVLCGLWIGYEIYRAPLMPDDYDTD